MAKTVTISDELAERIEARRAAAGLPSLDAAAETLIAHGLLVDVDDDDIGMTADELRAAIAEAEASGPLVPWDAAEVRAEIQRRVAEKP